MALSILSALLLALSFSTFNAEAVVFIGFVPLFFAIERKTARETAFVSYVSGVVFFLASMYWLIYVTITGWVLLSLYQGLYFCLFGLLYNRCCYYERIKGLNQLSFKGYLFICSLWCILEYFRSNIGGGIGWNLLGYSQYKNLPLIQIADTTGVYGVSFLIILVNIMVFCGIKMAINCQKTHKCLFAKSDKPIWIELRSHLFLRTIAVSFIIFAVLFYGYVKIYSLSPGRNLPNAKLKVSTVQGNIPQVHKWDKDYRDEIIKSYSKLTAEAARFKPDLVIWPETSVPGYLNYDEYLLSEVKEIARAADTFLLAGSPMVLMKDEEEAGDYNSALLFSRTGELLQQYNKLHLVPMGEFVPFEKYLPYLRSILPLTGNFISGDEYTIFNLSVQNFQALTRFGVLICFEDIFPRLVSQFVKRGADFMVNITNDAWFGKSSAAYQHAANSVFRAVENRRPFVRSANTGQSCFIAITGRIYNSVADKNRELFVSGHKSDFVEIRKGAPLTFYTKWGDIFILFCAFLTGAFLFDYIRNHKV